MSSTPHTTPWASTDHDPLSNTERHIAARPKTLTVTAVSGEVIASYPDFDPGTPVRVLPPIISNATGSDTRIVDDNWAFDGPTRRPEYATIRHHHAHFTIAIERDRLQRRPTRRN